jgi:hypothetical protein
MAAGQLVGTISPLGAGRICACCNLKWGVREKNLELGWGRGLLYSVLSKPICRLEDDRHHWQWNRAKNKGEARATELQ